MTAPRLYAVGVGPGDPELLTLKAVRVLRAADVIIAPTGQAEAASYALGIVAGHLDRDRQQVLERVFPMSRDETELQPFWDALTRFRELQTANGRLAARRHAQDQAWMWERIEAGLRQRFKTHPAVRDALPRTTDDVRAGRLAPSVAARRLLDLMH